MAHKKENKSKEKTVDFFEFVNQKYIHILVAIVLFLFIAPIVVCVCYSVFSTQTTTGITADGMLSYIGVIITSVVSVLACTIAIYQSKRAEDLQEEQEIKKRRNEICPSINISCEINSEGLYLLSLENIGKYSAVGIYWNTGLLVQNLKGGERKSLRFKRDGLKELMECDVNTKAEWYDDRYPQKIDLFFNDVDRNGICQSFQITTDLIYQGDLPEYY